MNWHWERKIEAQIATIDRFPNYLPSGLHTSEITALLRQLLDVAVAADNAAPLIGDWYVGKQILDTALDKLREADDG
jgi:hypothetical protein